MYEDPEDVRMKVWTSAVVAAIACSSLVLTAQTPADRSGTKAGGAKRRAAAAGSALEDRT